jgi:hypothetical protein
MHVPNNKMASSSSRVLEGFRAIGIVTVPLTAVVLKVKLVDAISFSVFN